MALDIWVRRDHGAFEEGQKLGAGIRRKGLDREYAKRLGGDEAGGEMNFDGALSYASEKGDLEGMVALQDRQHTLSERDRAEQKSSLEWFATNAPYANRIVAAMKGRDAAGRAQIAQAQHVRDRFKAMGFTDEQIDGATQALGNPETSDRMLGELEEAFGLGSKYVDIKEVDGALVGYGIDGTPTELRAAAPKVGVSPNGVAYAQGPDGSVNVTGQVPGYAVPRGGDADGRPKLSKDYRYNDAGDAEPIPGSPAAVKLAESKRKADLMMLQLEGGAANVARAIATANKLAENDSNMGMGGALMSNVPGGGQHDLAAAIETIQANLGFDKLAQMRAASPTGGALGATSDREISLLSAVVANLKQSQSPAQFRQNLTAVATQYKNTLAAIKEAYANDYSGVAEGAGDGGGSPYGAGDVATVNTQEEYDALPPGTVYQDATGQTKRKR